MDKYFGFAKELLAKGLAKEAEAYSDNSTYDMAIKFTADLDFYLELARELQGPILDIGCGTGRVLTPLLQAGYSAVGLDMSANMLSFARAKLKTAGLTAPLHQGDMRDFSIGSEFRLIIIPYFAMIYMYEDWERQQVFRCCYRHLAPGGVLAFDFDAGVNTIGLSQPWLGFQTADANGQVTLQTVQINHLQDRLRLVNIITYRLGARQDIAVNSSLEASISAPRMKELLESAGFKVRGFYGDYVYTPYNGGEECIVVSEKPQADY